MKQSNLCAAVTAMLCIAPLAVSYAQSNKEVFSPGTGVLAYDDGQQTNTGSFGGFGYEVIGGHAVAEGDMVLGRVDGRGNLINNVLGSSNIKNRGLGLARIIDRWENGVIPYQFDETISDEERLLSEQAIEHWNINTSISLVEVTDVNRSEYENYIHFESSNGCASYVGMIGGEQPLWISASCGVGSIIHEIGHAVGLFHEHTRLDRDNFITVQTSNIQEGKVFNFDVLEVNVQLLGEYDYSSIMHYGERFFSNNNEKTIIVNDGVSEIGQRDALSERDIQSANKLYETDLALSVTSNSAEQGNELFSDISVTNQGESGANGLSLSLRLTDGGNWRATSQNPGWDCVPNGALLSCERDNLEATESSLFSVVADVSSSSNSSLAVELTSNTFDTDLSNNGHNSTVTEQSTNNDTGNNQPSTNDDSGNTGSGFINQTSTETSTAGSGPINQQTASESTANEQTASNLATNAQNSQQSSQPLASTSTSTAAAAAAVNNTTVELGAALPDTASEAPQASSSSSGGAFSPLGAIALFLLSFSARIRRANRD